jgi:hypothetical protein
MARYEHNPQIRIICRPKGNDRFAGNVKRIANPP